MSSSDEMALVPTCGWRFTFPGGVVLAWENLEGAFAARPAPAEQLTAETTAFALSHESDAVGIAAMDLLYVFEGYTVRRLALLRRRSWK